LPANATFRDLAAEQVATRALLRARIRAWKVRARLRFGAVIASMMTLFMVLRVSHTHHIHLVPLVFLGLVWTWLALSFVRRRRRAAWRVRGALDDAYALAGLGTVAVPRIRVRTEASAPIAPNAPVATRVQETREAEVEDPNDPADALADFDRRLAAVRKGN
jgi:hypothetical protein